MVYLMVARCIWSHVTEEKRKIKLNSGLLTIVRLMTKIQEELQTYRYGDRQSDTPNSKKGCLLGPVVQSPISANPGLTLNKTYRVNPGLALITL